MSGSNQVFQVWIINKAGGLIYNKNYADGLPDLTANEYLVLAGTFHGLHAITARLSPTGSSSGVEVLEAETFKMTCLQTPTGTKLVLTTAVTHSTCRSVLDRIYEAYADQLKDPFYTADMPIRNEGFDNRINAICKN